MPSTEAKPWWVAAKIPAHLDIAMLRPASLPKGQRFETLEDALERGGALEKALLKQSPRRRHVLAEFLSDCREGHYFCGKLYCPLCARRYRRWFIGELLRLLGGKGDAKIVTVYLDEFPVGDLGDADLMSLHGTLRAALRRCGFVGCTIAGGTEVSYQAKDDVWLIHVHLLVLGASKDAIERLRKTLARRGPNNAVVCQALRDPIKQLSYIQKFATFHRPGQQLSARRARAYPLPHAPLVELVEFMAGYRFEDFAFLFGVRRQGAHLVKKRRK